MGRYNGRHGRGYSRKLRELKRTEAEIRNEAYQERKVATMLEPALANSAEGNVKDLGDFTQFAGRPLRPGLTVTYSGFHVQSITTDN